MRIIENAAIVAKRGEIRKDEEEYAKKILEANIESIVSSAIINIAKLARIEDVRDIDATIRMCRKAVSMLSRMMSKTVVEVYVSDIRKAMELGIPPSSLAILDSSNVFIDIGMDTISITLLHNISSDISVSMSLFPEGVEDDSYVIKALDALLRKLVVCVTMNRIEMERKRIEYYKNELRRCREELRSLRESENSESR